MVKECPKIPFRFFFEMSTHTHIYLLRGVNIYFEDSFSSLV